MGEYTKKKQNQISRTIINCKRRGNQYKNEMNIQNKTIQMTRTYVIEELNLFGTPKSSFLTLDALTIHSNKILTSGNPDTGFSEFHTAIHQPHLLPLTINEPLILVSHGTSPSFWSGAEFGSYTPYQLAQALLAIGIFPPNYNGEIYIDGCNTAKGESESFAFLLKRELIAGGGGLNLTNIKVKGNINTVFTTHRNGNDYSEINDDDFLIRMQGYAQTLIGTPNAVSGSGRYESGECKTKTF